MLDLFNNENFTYIIISFIISIVGIVYITLHHKNYGSKINIALIVLVYVLDGFVYFALFLLSTYTYFHPETALILWNISLMVRLFSLGILNTLFVMIWGSPEKKGYYLILIQSILGGIVIALTFFEDSIQLIESGIDYYYILANDFLLFFTALYYLSFLFFLWAIVVINYPKVRDKNLGLLVILISSYFTINVMMYFIFVITQAILFKILHIIFYLTSAVILLYAIIKVPDLFFAITNNIYDFIILHRSGILLYSYNFQTNKEIDETSLKGSILIGINHIFMNLNKRISKLDTIKMKEMDILIEYNTKNGFAILLITDNKDTIIQNALENFENKFSEKFSALLEDLNSMNTLIDTSQFYETRELISSFFKPYILKSES